MRDPRSPQDHSSSKRTKALIDSYYKAYETGLYECLMPFMHKDHRYYPPGGAKAEDLFQRMQEERRFLAAFSSVKVKVCDQIVDGNKAAMRVLMSAIHSGDFHGIKATGRSVAIPYMEIVWIEDDKILEDWTEFEMGAILQQIS